MPDHLGAERPEHASSDSGAKADDDMPQSGGPVADTEVSRLPDDDTGETEVPEEAGHDGADDDDPDDWHEGDEPEGS